MAEDNNDKEQQTLSDVVRGIQHAVNTSLEVVETHYINLFSRYFDESNNPHKRRINLSKNKFIEVPLIALIPSKSLTLDEMDIDMTIRIDDSKTKEFNKDKAGPTINRTSFGVSFSSGSAQDDQKPSNAIQINLKFKRLDPPEGVSRIIEAFTSQVTPHSTDNSKQE